MDHAKPLFVICFRVSIKKINAYFSGQESVVIGFEIRNEIVLILGAVFDARLFKVLCSQTLIGTTAGTDWQDRAFKAHIVKIRI